MSFSDTAKSERQKCQDIQCRRSLMHVIGNCLTHVISRANNVPCFLLVFFFILTRLPFFVYYPFVVFTPDSWTYSLPSYVLDFSSQEVYLYNSFIGRTIGTLPAFDVRTPGYPMFVFIVRHLLDGNNITIALVQSLLTLLSTIFYVKIIQKFYGTMAAILHSLVCCIFITSSIFISQEFTYAPESVYTNVIILFISLLILSLNSPGIFSLATASTAIALAIFLRPNDMYLLVIAFFCVIYMFVNSYSRKYIFAFIAPCCILLLSLTTYNYLTIRSFSISHLGSLNLIGATIFYMEPDNEYPPVINNLIIRIQAAIPENIKQAFKNSTNTEKTFEAYLSYFVLGSMKFYAGMYGIIDSIDKEDVTKPIRRTRFIRTIPYLRTIALKAIAAHPLYT
ncbi:membrane protein [Candidatus Magnetobacterium bavaricum]|uniref:Membrane protein n=1 Tax=Candidatus Magnetobacterium bavaricum TaxID=29290 RepID=A0A0F3GMF4_9BACT|nr:membrane protein [Candidatus Magnetobacterium bavaricum]